MYVRVAVYIIVIITIIILLLGRYTDKDDKLFGKEIWPVKKEERFDKLIVLTPRDKLKDRTLFDPYSITHITHGILLYYITNYFNPNKNLENLYLSLFAEIIWEILENNETLINLYKKHDKYSRDYIGDSIVNIFTDIIFMIVGYLFASKYKKAYMFVIVSEILLYIIVNDNFTRYLFNVILLPIMEYS